MLIFHVITLSSVGGAQSVVVNLANAQVRENEVCVVSSASGDAWQALDPRVRVIRISQLRREISWRDLIVLLKLFYYRFRLRPDVVHLHSSKMGALGRVAFPAGRIVYTVHGFDSIRIANRKFLRIEKALKNRCAHIVGVSRYDEGNLKAEGIVRGVGCIYNGIDDKSAEEKSDVNVGVREKMVRIKHRYDKIVVCIARDDRQKKIDLFIEVAALMPQYAFVWIGNRREHAAGDNVCLMGQIPMAYQLLGLADLFFLPTNYEGLPMCIIEAMAHGLPVVASNVGGIPELLDGMNGCVVENDKLRMSEKIRTVLSDPELYGRMSARARQDYEQRFTVDRMAGGYFELYKAICSGRRPDAAGQ